MNDDETAVQLELGEAASSTWKSMTLSVFADPDQYRVVSEMQGGQNPYTIIFNLAELVNSRSVLYKKGQDQNKNLVTQLCFLCKLLAFRLCFWKDDGDLFNPRQNYYMMVDGATSLKPQHSYKFYWIRDQ